MKQFPLGPSCSSQYHEKIHKSAASSKRRLLKWKTRLRLTHHCSVKPFWLWEFDCYAMRFSVHRTGARGFRPTDRLNIGISGSYFLWWRVSPCEFCVVVHISLSRLTVLNSTLRLPWIDRTWICFGYEQWRDVAAPLFATDELVSESTTRTLTGRRIRSREFCLESSSLKVTLVCLIQPFFSMWFVAFEFCCYIIHFWSISPNGNAISTERLKYHPSLTDSDLYINI